MCVAESKKKSPKIESELTFAYAKTNKNEELEQFINKSGCCANILETGERCFDAGLYDAAKILFTNLGDNGRLAAALVRLGDFQSAVEAAKKDGGMRTWKEVNVACVEAGEFALAQVAALAIIGRADELDELLNVYESRGHFDEIIAVLEAALNSGETTHQPLFTELAGLYSKYKEEKLLDFIKHHYNDMNLGKVIHYATQNEQYKELVFLYVQYKEPDNAALTMIKYGAIAWEHAMFKETLKEVSNTDICYQATEFYLSDHPNLVCDMLASVSDKIDHSRVVTIGRQKEHLPLLKPYMQAVQKANLTAVNEALNELYVEEEDFEALRSSIDIHDNYDNLKLAAFCKDHEMLEFRRIAAFVYKKNGKWAESVELSKRDKLYKDAIQTAADSRKTAVVEDLLRFFCEPAQPECFAATLYTCYDSVAPDVALELAWRHKLMDVGMPYLIQMLKEYTQKVDELVEAAKPKENDEQDSFQATPGGLMNQVPQIGYYPGAGDPGMGGMGGPGMMGGQGF
jgi:clathrin heavy chain